MKLSLIIPCYNEEGNVLPLYQKVKDTFEGQLDNYEFIFVNDGSFDGTKDKLKELVDTAELPVTVVNFSRNFGKEAAIYAGLERATGEYTTLIDGDLQQNPSFVLDMVAYLDSHPDTDSVCAFQESRQESFLNIFLKDSFYKIVNAVTDVSFVNGASDFRTFRENVRTAVLSLPEYNRFSKGLFSWVGFETYYMPYTVEARLSGSSKWSLLKLFRYALDGIMDFTIKPLLFPLAAGGLAALGSTFFFLKVLLGEEEKNADAKLLFSTWFLGSLQLISLGILSDYIGNIFQQSKGRPIYIAKSVWTNKK